METEEIKSNSPKISTLIKRIVVIVIVIALLLVIINCLMGLFKGGKVAGNKSHPPDCRLFRDLPARQPLHP